MKPDPRYWNRDRLERLVIFDESRLPPAHIADIFERSEAEVRQCLDHIDTRKLRLREMSE